MKDQTYILLCLEEAKVAYEKGEVPVGCVVVKDENVVARAHNRVEELKDPTAHAEMLALKEASDRLGEKYLYGCRIYVSLEPCIMCTYSMVLRRIERVLFLARDERHGGVISLYNVLDDTRLNHRVKWTYIPDDRAEELLKKFFKGLRKQRI